MHIPSLFDPTSLEVLIVIEKEVGGNGTHETGPRLAQSGENNDPSQLLPVSSHLDVNVETHSVISSQDEFEGVTCAPLTIALLG